MRRQLKAALLGVAFLFSASKSIAGSLVIGDVIPNVQVDTVAGEPIDFAQILADKPSILIYAKPSTFKTERESGSLKTLVPYFDELGYQVILIASEPASELKDLADSYKVRRLFVDHEHRAQKALGLLDKGAQNAIYILDANRRILNESISLSDEYPMSGEDLVLAARVYKDARKKSPTGFLFQTPDSSILDLLVHPDISNHDRWFYSFEVGGSLLEARQEIFMPRWQPGAQFGRRFGRTGVFATFQYNESFDFTQEVKKLEVYHLGIGVDHLFLYGRVRTSAAAGLAILGTQTDFDSKGTKGWFLDVRPLSVRFNGFGTQVLEVTPLSMNLSIPVARGIPLILFSYFTTLSMEFGG